MSSFFESWSLTWIRVFWPYHTDVDGAGVARVVEFGHLGTLGYVGHDEGVFAHGGDDHEEEQQHEDDVTHGAHVQAGSLFCFFSGESCH